MEEIVLLIQLTTNNVYVDKMMRQPREMNMKFP